MQNLINEGDKMRDEIKVPPEIMGKTLGGCEAARESAVGVIEGHVRYLRKQADGLEALVNQLPRQLSREADEALWQIAIGLRRR